MEIYLSADKTDLKISLVPKSYTSGETRKNLYSFRKYSVSGHIMVSSSIPEKKQLY
jgi:hypothetical protein